MNHQINAYFAALIVTIVGATASYIIIHVAESNTFVVSYSGGVYHAIAPKTSTVKK